MERIILFTALVFCTALFLFTPAVHAWQAYDPFIRQRMGRQEHRVNQGIASGRLTAGETARLLDMQARIRTEEMAMKSNGRLTGRERIRLHRDLNHSNRAIYRMKHNSSFAY